MPLVTEKEVFVVTGANSGLGLALVRQLVATGVDVIGVDREVENIPLAATIVEQDLLSGDFSKLFSILDQYVQPQISLINNAGICLSGPFLNHSTKRLREMIGINFEVPIILTFEILKKYEVGKLINISSSSALFPLSNFSVYGATKVALGYWSTIISQEVPKSERPTLKVWTFMPGAMKTNLMVDSKSSLGVMSPERAAQKIIKIVHEKKAGLYIIGFRARLSLLFSRFPPAIRNLLIQYIFN